MAVTRLDAGRAWMEQSPDQWEGPRPGATKENKRLKSGWLTCRIVEVSGVIRPRRCRKAPGARGADRDAAAANWPIAGRTGKKSRSSSRIPPSVGIDMEQGRSG